MKNKKNVQEELNEKTIITVPETTPDTVPETTPDTVPETTPDTVPETYKGVVSGCVKLNVRKEANTDAEIICVIDENTEVVVDEPASTEDFFKIVTVEGIEGFCMSKYITIK